MCTGTLYERARHAQRVWDKQASIADALDRQIAAERIEWSPIAAERLVQIENFVNEFLTFTSLGGPEWYEFCFDHLSEKV